MNRLLAARLSSVDPTDADALAQLGFDLAHADEDVESAWCFQRAADLEEKWAFNLGHQLVELRRLDAAVAAFARAAAAGVSDAFDPMGWCLEELGDLAGAMQAYESGLAEGSLDAGMSKAFLLRSLGDQPDAFELAEELAARGSVYADAVAACWLFCTTRDPALEQRLRAGADRFPSARADLAKLLRDTDRLSEALHVLQRGADLNETESFLPLGNLLADDLDDRSAAEAAYRAGIEAGDTNCHNNLGVLLEEIGRLDEARQQYELAIAAGNALARRNLAELEDGE